MRTLANLDLGTSVFLKENGVNTEYYLIDKKQNSVTLIRRFCNETKRMNPQNTTVYDGCEADVYLNNEESGFLSIFDQATRNALVQKEISTFVYGGALSTIARKCFLLSEDECWGSNSVENDRPLCAAFQIATGLNSWNNALIGYSEAGSAVIWWLRSPNSATQFRNVNTNGTAGNSNATNTNFWLRPALSFAPATIVSDEGADTISLLPNGEKLAVDATVIIGTSSSRPKSARVIYDAVNMSNVSVKVCNNAKDENPSWVDATSGTATLSNTSKTTEEWVIGVKLSGKTDNGGFFREPVVITEE